MTTKTKKAFDCVEMMHRGQAELLRKLEKMTPEEQDQYWRERYEDALRLQRQIRAERASQG
jgi:hypothetical protein